MAPTPLLLYYCTYRDVIRGSGSPPAVLLLYLQGCSRWLRPPSCCTRSRGQGWSTRAGSRPPHRGTFPSQPVNMHACKCHPKTYIYRQRPFPRLAGTLAGSISRLGNEKIPSTLLIRREIAKTIPLTPLVATFHRSVLFL